MEIVSPIRFAVGIAFALAAVVLGWLGRRERGLGPLRQVAGLCVLGAIAFTAGGLGYSLWGDR
jgi:uncharacterized protein (TIGR03382 family)